MAVSPIPAELSAPASATTAANSPTGTKTHGGFVRKEVLEAVVNLR